MLNIQFEYLASHGFSNGEMSSNLCEICSRSLENFIKIRVEQAFRKCRTQEERPDLNTILCKSQVAFEKRFGVN